MFNLLKSQPTIFYSNRINFTLSLAMPEGTDFSASSLTLVIVFSFFLLSFYFCICPNGV